MLVSRPTGMALNLRAEDVGCPPLIKIISLDFCQFMYLIALSLGKKLPTRLAIVVDCMAEVQFISTAKRCS